MAEPASPPAALSPGSTIGILGGGQLGRMLSVAASRLGLKAHIYNDEPDAPAFDVGAVQTVGAYDDERKIAAFAECVDVVTCEFENVPAKTLEVAGSETAVFPPPRSFEVSQDRVKEKDFVHGLGIAVAPYAAVDSIGDLNEALARVKTPALLKTRRFGYDGKGQVPIHTLCEAQSAWDKIDAAPAILEGMVAFEREISVLAVRAQDGDTRFYDVVENVHQGGILATSRVPSRLSDTDMFAARQIAGEIAAALGHVGVLCVEMFQCAGEPRLVVNEIAPRVHNSGHWTLDGCLVSQFENHVRAIAGWPLGDVGRHSNAVMTNLIGDEVNNWRTLASEPGAGLHIYGKRQARPGRKMGHVTRVSPKT